MVMATSRICLLSKSLAPLATRALSVGNGQTAIFANINATRGLANFGHLVNRNCSTLIRNHSHFETGGFSMRVSPLTPQQNAILPRPSQLLVSRQFHAVGSITKYLDYRHRFKTNHLRLHLKIIKKQKMKKHKLKKFRKRFKALLAKRRFVREINKEKSFRVELLSMVRDAEDFDPRKYALNAIEAADRVSNRKTPEQKYEEFRERCRIERHQTWYIKPRHKTDPDIEALQ